MSAPAYQGNLSTALTNTNNFRAWERFGVEFILSFMIVLTYLTTMDSYNKWLSNSSLTIGAAYAACTFVSMPYLNPARSLGPSFVLSKWENHWVYWIAPLTGGIISGLVYEYLLNPRRQKSRKDTADGDSCVQSEEDPYDDLEKPSATKSSTSYKYRAGGNTAVTSSSSYSPSLMSTSFYSAPLSKVDRAESVYGGTKSLYCKSPPLTRANLNRSQSVYTKTNSGNLRDSLPRSGPLVPAQSLYSMRVNQQSHVQNQNLQNQLQQRTESTCNGRPAAPLGIATRTDGYNGVGAMSTKITTPDSDNNTKFEDVQKLPRRPESLYGMARQPDDCNYSAYYGSAKRSNTNNPTTYHNTANQGAKFGCHNATTYGPRNSELKHSTASNSFHHIIPQHSPSSQY